MSETTGGQYPRPDDPMSPPDVMLSSHTQAGLPSNAPPSDIIEPHPAGMPNSESALRNDTGMQPDNAQIRMPISAPASRFPARQLVTTALPLQHATSQAQSNNIGQAPAPDGEAMSNESAASPEVHGMALQNALTAQMMPELGDERFSIIRPILRTASGFSGQDDYQNIPPIMRTNISDTAYTDPEASSLQTAETPSARSRDPRVVSSPRDSRLGSSVNLGGYVGPQAGHTGGILGGATAPGTYQTGRGSTSSRANTPQGDMIRIKDLIYEKATLVSHLNRILSEIGLSYTKLKKAEKQDSILAYAGRSYDQRQFPELRRVRAIVERNVPNGTTVQPPPQTYLESVNSIPVSEPDIRPSGADHVIGSMSTGVNPLGVGSPLQTLSFRSSPFYVLTKQLDRPAFFLRPHTRKRLQRHIVLNVPAHALDSGTARLFLLCQEYDPKDLGNRPIYFPFYTEIEIDQESVKANTRGVRGAMGSAKPVDLTKYALSNSGGKSRHVVRITVHISDQGEPTSSRSFAFAAFLAEKWSLDSMVDSIKQRPHIGPEVTKEMAAQAAASDEEIMSSEAIYSLKDKVMMTRISTPVRSRLCTHIDCFDAMSFLMLQDQAETWKCPVCNRNITYESIAVDDFFCNILSSASNDVDTVSIHADGSWTVKSTDSSDEESSDDDMPRPPMKKQKTEPAVEIVDLLSDSDTDDTPRNAGTSRQAEMLSAATQSTVNSNLAIQGTAAQGSGGTFYPMPSDSNQTLDRVQAEGYRQAETTTAPEAVVPTRGESFPVSEALLQMRSSNQTQLPDERRQSAAANVGKANTPPELREEQQQPPPSNQIRSMLMAMQNSQNVIFNKPFSPIDSQYYARITNRGIGITQPRDKLAARSASPETRSQSPSSSSVTGNDDGQAETYSSSMSTQVAPTLATPEPATPHDSSVVPQSPSPPVDGEDVIDLTGDD